MSSLEDLMEVIFISVEKINSFINKIKSNKTIELKNLENKEILTDLISKIPSLYLFGTALTANYLLFKRKGHYENKSVFEKNYFKENIKNLNQEFLSLGISDLQFYNLNDKEKTNQRIVENIQIEEYLQKDIKQYYNN